MNPIQQTTPRERASHIWKREKHDHYVEPHWVSERLFAKLNLTKGMTVLDPACGFGRIPAAAAKHSLYALGSDIVARWEHLNEGGEFAHFEVSDFLESREFRAGSWPVRQTPGWQFPDAIVSNPPFKHAQAFADLALRRAVTLVALLLPTKWVQGEKRSRWLESTPLHVVMPIAPRPSMPPGHVIFAGTPPGGGTVDFSWFVWLKGYRGKPMIEWLRRDAS